jgi:hypothetical protein
MKIGSVSVAALALNTAGTTAFSHQTPSSSNAALQRNLVTASRAIDTFALRQASSTDMQLNAKMTEHAVDKAPRYKESDVVATHNDIKAPKLRLAGEAVTGFTRNVLRQAGMDLYRSGAMVNTLSYKTTVALLGTPIDALRKRQAPPSKGSVTRLDCLKVIVELGVGPLAMMVSTGLMLSLLAKQPVNIAKCLIPLEALRIAHQQWREGKQER